MGAIVDRLSLIDWGIALCAAAAALLWFAAAMVRTPTIINVFHTTGLISFGPELAILTRALRRQNLLSSAAALCAGAAAALLSAEILFYR